MYPWEQYPAGDPRGDPNNWVQPDGSTGWAYAGPTDPSWNTSTLNGGGVPPMGYTGGGASTYYGGVGGLTYQGGDSQIQVFTPTPAGPPPPPAYDPLSSAYPSAPATTQQGTNAAAEFTGPYVPLDQTSLAPAPTTIGMGNGAGGTIGLGTGQTDFATPLAPVYLGGPAVAPPALPAPLAPAPAAPLASPGGPVATPQYQSGGASGFVAGGGGGFAGGGTAPNPFGAPMPAAPGAGGAPRAMGPAGFDPFLWAGVANPLPPASPTRQMILGELGISGPPWAMGGAPPAQMPAPVAGPPPALGPMGYVEAKLGLGEPEPAPLPPPPVMPAVPPRPVGGLPPLPLPPLPRRAGS